jgi:hypothetical protein
VTEPGRNNRRYARRRHTEQNGASGGLRLRFASAAADPPHHASPTPPALARHQVRLHADDAAARRPVYARIFSPAEDGSTRCGRSPVGHFSAFADLFAFQVTYLVDWSFSNGVLGAPTD